MLRRWKVGRLSLIWIDHVLLSARNLEAARDRLFVEHGLAAYDGGAHVEYGTANWIVPVGQQYLELLGVADEEVARGHPIGQWALAAVAKEDHPLHWNVGTDDIEGDATRLGLDIEHGTRVLPDGTVARFAHIDTAVGLTDPVLPFYVGWDYPAEHPGLRAVAHRVPATSIVWVELAVASAERRRQLDDWLGGAELPLRIVEREPEGITGVGIAVAGGSDIVIGRAATSA